MVLYQVEKSLYHKEVDVDTRTTCSGAMAFGTVHLFLFFIGKEALLY